MQYHLAIILGVIFGILISVILLFIFIKYKTQYKKEDGSSSKKEEILLELSKPITAEQFRMYYSDLKENPSKIRNEYSDLAFTAGSTSIANLPINKKKNRYIDILPCMNFFDLILT